MKYYIPISSLNVDNILATESISPKSFYGERSFGYRYFETIEQLPYEDVIVLFSEVPYFEINDRTRSNHATIVQIEDDVQLENIKQIGEYEGCKIFAYSTTVHLSPYNCKILFLSHEAQIESQQKCAESKYNKLFEKFVMRTVEYTESEKALYLNDVAKKINTNDFPKATAYSNDSQCDRVKGFIYGFYMGASLSVSSELAKMIAIRNEIYDIVASVTRENKISDQLRKKLEELDANFRANDTETKRAKDEWEKLDISKGKSYEEIKELGVEATAKENLCKLKGISLPIILPRNLDELGKYSESISTHTERLIGRYRQKAGSIKIVESLDIAPDYNTAILSATDEESMLLNKILDKIIWSGVVPDTNILKSDRNNVVKKVVEAIKAMFEDDNNSWDNSPERGYLNALYRNVVHYSPFDVKSLDSIVLQSLAIFLLKGDDSEELIKYMESHEISDYRYVLTLWGAVNGYVQISRTIFTKYILIHDFESLYADVHKLLYRKNLAKMSSSPISPSVVFANETKEEPHHEPNEFNLRSKVYTVPPKDEKEKQAIDEALDKANNDPKIFIEELSKSLDGRSSTYKKLKKEFYPNFSKNDTQKSYKNRSKKKNSQENLVQGELFQQNMLENRKWIEEIIGYFPLDKDAKKSLKIDLEWFIDNHKPEIKDSKKGMVRGIYADRGRSNNEILDRLTEYLENRVNPKSEKTEWLREKYKNIPVEEILNFLRKKFL